MKLKKLIGKIVSLAAVASIAVSCLPVIGAQAETKVKTYVFEAGDTDKGWYGSLNSLISTGGVSQFDDEWTFYNAKTASNGIKYLGNDSVADRNGNKKWITIAGADSSSTNRLMLQPYTESEAENKIIYFNFDYVCPSRFSRQ